MTDEAAVLRYYAHDDSDLVPVIMHALAAAGRDVENLSVDDLAGIDEFHALGRSATIALGELAGIGEGDRVADLGAGIGGPARYLASRLGAQVTAVEPTTRFRRACEELTRRVELADRITTVEGTATATGLEDGSMDVVWMQAVALSISDKQAMAREVRRVLRPGGRLAFFDFTSGPGGDPYFPALWADGPETDFVVEADALRVTFEAAALEPQVWNEHEAALKEISRHEFQPQVDPGVVNLGVLIPGFPERIGNAGRSIAEGRLRLLQAVLRAA